MANKAPSLFRRLMGAISLVLLVSSGTLIWFASDYARTMADNVHDGLLAGAALQISETITVSDGAVLTDIPVSAFDVLSVSKRERVYYRVAGPDGRTLTGYDELRISDDEDNGGMAPQFRDMMFKGSPVRVALARYPVSDPNITGSVSILLAQTRDTRNALAASLTLQATVMIGIMSLITLAGVALATRYALRPLHRIEQALGGRDPNDLTPLDIKAPAEIEELTQSINRFMGRLAARMDAIQKVIADAAHQIRTPVTALAAQVELLKTETAPARRKHHLERVSARTAEVGRLVSQLLSHAMVSHRAESMVNGRFDLADLLRQAVSDAVPLAMDRDISVTLTAPPEPSPFAGDAVSLREAVRNIIENAVHHGARHKAEILLKRTQDAYVVECRDDGPGIAREDWPDAPKRFSRGQSGGNGSGLGLAIASDVAKHHGGALDFDFCDNGDFLVRLTLPANGGSAP
ncbi:MAG: sensor histidine kinase [Rhizobiaceae bacterium]